MPGYTQDDEARLRWQQQVIDDLYQVANLLEFGGECVDPVLRCYDEARMVFLAIVVEHWVDDSAA